MSGKTLTVASIILTFAIYTAVFGPIMGATIVIAISWHECGHLLAAKALKMRIGQFYLMPFIGGVSFVKDRYKTSWHKAIVVLAGPFAGLVLVLIVASLNHYLKDSRLNEPIHLMAILNLFNLAALTNILDGGQLMTTISNSINRTATMVLICATTALAVVLLLRWNPLISYGGKQAMREYHNWKNLRDGNRSLVDDDYLYPLPKLSIIQMLMVGGGWAITAFALYQF
jgi:hypothetical protein